MNYMKNIIPTTFCFSLLILLTSCATILSGINQKIDINSTPTAARVTINGEFAGETPLTAKLRRYKNNLIQIELDGYEPYEMITKRRFNPISLGNLIIGGGVGMIIDLTSGGIYNIDPSIISAKLNMKQEESTIGIGVIEGIKPEWKKSLSKVGQLTKKRIPKMGSDNLFNNNLGISLYGDHSNEELLTLETGTTIRGVVVDPNKMGGCDRWDKLKVTKIEPDKWQINHLKTGQSIFVQTVYEQDSIVFNKIAYPSASRYQTK